MEIHIDRHLHSIVEQLEADENRTVPAQTLDDDTIEQVTTGTGMSIFNTV